MSASIRIFQIPKVINDIDNLAHDHLDVNASVKQYRLARNALRTLFLGVPIAVGGLMVMGMLWQPSLLLLMGIALGVCAASLACFFVALRGNAEAELLKLNAKHYLIRMPLVWALAGSVSCVWSLFYHAAVVVS